MRILFIYKEYGGRRKLYGQMMKNLGHQVSYFAITNKLKSNQVRIKHIKEAKPDLVWVLSPFYIAYKCISKDAMGYIKKCRIPISLYGTFNVVVPYPSWIEEVWKQIDFLFVHHAAFDQYLKKNGLNSYYIPLGFYPSQYFKCSSEKTLDVSFMGNCQTASPPHEDKRAQYLQALKKYNMIVYGQSFIGRLKKIEIKHYKGHDKQRKVYAKTKINLDLPFINGGERFYQHMYHAKNRLFEVPATGNFLLTGRCKEFMDIFGEDTIGFYDDNVESLKENIDRYLRDEGKRKKMAEKAYQIVHEKHTYQHRFNDMFKIIDGK